VTIFAAVRKQRCENFEIYLFAKSSYVQPASPYMLGISKHTVYDTFEGFNRTFTYFVART